MTQLFPRQEGQSTASLFTSGLSSTATMKRLGSLFEFNSYFAFSGAE